LPYWLIPLIQDVKWDFTAKMLYTGGLFVTVNDEWFLVTLGDRSTINKSKKMTDK